MENQFTCEYPDYTLLNGIGILGRKPHMMIKFRSIPSIFTNSVFLAAAMVLILCTLGSAQTRSNETARSTAEENAFGEQITGMYSFLREGEFVQITVEEGKLSGFVSRYGDRDSDRDAFLDQFFSKGSLHGKNISFTTKPVHGTWYEFSGDIGRGDAKTPDKEGYWVIRGTLKKYSEDEDKHVSAESRQVTFKSFPQDVDKDEQPR